jgi:hypothetical protein
VSVAASSQAENLARALKTRELPPRRTFRARLRGALLRSGFLCHG